MQFVMAETHTNLPFLVQVNYMRTAGNIFTVFQRLPVVSKWPIAYRFYTNDLSHRKLHYVFRNVIRGLLKNQ